MTDESIDWGDIFKAAAVEIAALALQEGLKSLMAGKQKAVGASFPSQVSASPAYILVGGWSKTPGLTVFKDSSTNAFACVQAIHDGRMSPPDKWYLNENNVTVSPYDYRVTAVYDGTTAVTDGRYTDDPGQRVNLQYRVGNATETAYPDLTSRFSTWTTSHRGDGTGSISMQCFAPDPKFQGAIFPVGIPTASVVTRPDDIYDWRDESQDKDDPTTWGPCSNPVVNWVHSEWFRWGRNWDRCVAPVLDGLTAEADICDEMVSLHAGGTEPRYACAGGYWDDLKRDDIRQKYKAACDGWFGTDRRGRLVIKSGHFEEPTFVLTADYIEDYSWSRGVSRDVRVDKLTVSFIDPASDYNENAVDPWIIDDTGDKTQALSLEWVTSWTQARRLAKRAAARANPGYTGQIKTGPYGFNGLGQRYIRIQNPAEASMADVVCEVVNAEFDPMTGQVVFDVVSADENIDAWNPATEEGANPASLSRADPGSLAAPTIGDATAFYEAVADGSDGARIAIDAEGPGRDDITWYYRWKVAASSTWNETTTTLSGGTVTINTGFVPVNSSIDVEVEYVTGSGSPSGWSATTTVSTDTSAIAPAEPVSLTLDGSTAGQAGATWQNPASLNFHGARLWRNTTGSGFGTASDVSGLRVAPANSSGSYTDTGVSAGTYDYWVTAENGSGAQSPEYGPVTVTVT